MDWPTRRQVLRVYLNDHDWWWKWPFIATALAMWVGALVLLVAPWDRAGSEEHIVGLPTPTAPDPRTDDEPTERVTSWSSRDDDPLGGSMTATALPTVEVPAESNQTGATTADADTDVIDGADDIAVEAGSRNSQRGDVVAVLVPSPRSSPSPTGPTMTTGPTTTGAPPATSSTATTTTTTATATTTTATAAPPAAHSPGPETSTTTTQPATTETAAPTTTTKPKGKGNAGRTDPTDDENLSDTKNGKVPPGQRADKRTD